ncbi:MAG: Ycf48-like protein [Chloroflexi bacterium]|nr:Ycf48-like protein [Chloroflexota bacterium]
MRHVIPIWTVLIFVLGGCNYPGDAPSPAGESPVAVTDESSPAVDLSPQPAVTGELLPTPTWTQPPEEESAPAGEATVSAPTASPSPDSGTAPHLRPLTSGDEVILSRIAMIDHSTGWGIGHQSQSDDHILYTRDGGQTWSDVTPPEPSPQQGEPRKVAWGYFADAQNAWVIYAYAEWRVVPPSPRVWATNDGGLSWQASGELDLTGQEEFFRPEGFSFPDLEHGWLLIHIGGGMHHDYSLLFRTSDGGGTWERLVDPFKTSLQSLGNTGLAFADEKVGWVTKDNMGVMFGAFWEHSEDGGRNWESSFLPAPPELDWMEEPNACRTEDLHFTSAHTAALIVNCRTFEEEEERSLTYIYVTGDRGQNWQYAKLPSPVDELDFIDYQTGWATGRDIYTTTDGGLSWVKIKTVNWDGQFSFVDSQTGWAVASNEEDAVLVKTENGGRTWALLEPVISDE